MGYQLEIITDTSLMEEQNKVVREGIISFNEPFIGSKPKRFSVYAKDKNQIIGGAIVYAHTTSIYIDVLWVDNHYRGSGIGTDLLNAVEQEALKRNISESTLDTFSFQAEEFYLKQGYTHLGTIKDYLEGYDRIYLRKKLR
ncbi:GNAT family N-acetyltransferase [Legionella sp. 29fVS95]|uniref:GNAT family N-acetyltransferase n=1 Tax=Legionella sp. 29fVS95 TaxID=3402813 RepID=UPI003AF99321